MRTNHTYRFDEATHTYYIDERPVPSVTQVMADMIPGWRAADWYLQRGRAVHACAAMVAQGLEFEHDERIAGQVAACRQFYRVVYGGILPTFVPVEFAVYSRQYQYAGTLDLLASFRKSPTLVDFKATLTDAVPIQLAGYAIALNERDGFSVKFGMGVQLNEDGTYKCSEVYDLRRYKAEWLALLTTYNVRRRLKIKEEETCQQN